MIQHRTNLPPTISTKHGTNQSTYKRARSGPLFGKPSSTIQNGFYSAPGERPIAHHCHIITGALPAWVSLWTA